MHELSVATSIVESVEEETHRAGGSSVSEIVLEIGILSGIIREALDFALEEAIKGTILQEADIRIEEIPGIAKCSSCGTEFRTGDHFTICPECMNPYTDIIQGKEMKIKSIKIAFK